MCSSSAPSSSSSSGAAPGKVFYTHHKTAYMTAEEADIRKISRETEAGEARNESK